MPIEIPRHPCKWWPSYIIYILNAPHHCVEHSRGRILTTSATYIFNIYIIYIYTTTAGYTLEYASNFPYIMLTKFVFHIHLHNFSYITKPYILDSKSDRDIHQVTFACLWITCLWPVVEVAMGQHPVCPKSHILSLSLPCRLPGSEPTLQNISYIKST